MELLLLLLVWVLLEEEEGGVVWHLLIWLYDWILLGLLWEFPVPYEDYPHLLLLLYQHLGLHYESRSLLDDAHYGCCFHHYLFP